MVKIIGICGSPRKKSSYKALSEALNAAKAQGNVGTELIELRGKEMKPCVHCNKCLRDDADRCTVFKDDMSDLYDKFYEADGVIIMSPVYDMNITPQLSTFFSRFRSAWKISAKDKYFFMKKVGAAMAVGGTRNGGQEAVISCITNFYNTHGITVCNGGGEVYSGVSCWSPGDGSTEMNDEEGMRNAATLGEKVAVMSKIMKHSQI